MTQDYRQLQLDLQDGKEHEVSKSTYDYYLGVLPPVTYDVAYQGQRWNFGFAEGFEQVTLFRKVGALDSYLAIQMPFFNPRQAGSFENQKQQLRLEWAKIGKREEAIRQHAPDFGVSSIEESPNDAALLADLAIPQPVGKGFHVGNICFINTSEAGDWLILKDNAAVAESMPVGLLIREKGLEHAQGLIDGIRALGHEPVRQLGQQR